MLIPDVAHDQAARRISVGELVGAASAPLAGSASDVQNDRSC